MDVKKGPIWHKIDIAIAEQASRQRGYITREQLLKLGLGTDAIKYRIRIGRLIRIHTGVYAVGHVPTVAQDRAYAVLLACGDGAVLSHGSPASAWGIDKVWHTPFEVTLPRRVRRPGIRTHIAELTQTDIRTQLGLKVTSPARTVLDIAPDLTQEEVERVVDNLRHTYLKLHQVAAVIERYPWHPGVKALRPVTENPSGPTRSRFERAFRAFVKRYGLPEPVINTRRHGHEPDVLFPAERVIVELDGWEFHSSRRSFRSDRARDAHYLARGYVTVRITWERLTQEPDALAAELHVILERQRRILARAS